MTIADKVALNEIRKRDKLITSYKKLLRIAQDNLKLIAETSKDTGSRIDADSALVLIGLKKEKWRVNRKPISTMNRGKYYE